MARELAFILVGDHLGQVKKLLQPSNEISLVSDCAPASKSNPVVSIEPLTHQNKQLIANRDGQVYIYDCVQDKTDHYGKFQDSLNKAVPLKTTKQSILLYDKKITLNDGSIFFKHDKKFSSFVDAKLSPPEGDKLVMVGIDIPLRIFDTETKTRIFDAEPPEKDWLGVSPECYVSGLDFVGQHRVVTCSRSDSVIRVYDPTLKQRKPVISANLDQVAFNEHADSARFHSIASISPSEQTVIVGSNVGQITAIDLRYQKVKTNHDRSKRRSKVKNYKVLGNFKGSRGGSIKDVKVIPYLNHDVLEYKVITCCLDRYLRIHTFNKQSRELDKHTFITTKPHRCSPVFISE